MSDISLLFQLGLGPWLTPLRGKLPVLDAWPTQPEVDEDTVRMWISHGYNLGFRTGSLSGLVVLDNDQAKHGASGWTMPPTGLRCLTGSGGEHGYFRIPPGCDHLRNSASKLAPYVDVRASGGQVVVPPSVHPLSGTAYRWISTDAPAELPASIIAALTPVRVNLAAPVPARSGDYAGTALAREVHRVRTAPEGTRNHTLNTAAFNLGQLVAGGTLTADRVRDELAAAAVICGLPTSEAAATITSGLRGGSNSPRGVPERTTATVAPAPAPRPPRDVLVPGSHTLPGGEYVEQGTHTFAEQVLAAIDPASLYRRAGAIGELHAGQFVPISPERMRSIVDSSVRLTAGKPPARGSESDEPTVVYRTCTHDNASVLVEYASVRGQCRDLRHIATHPVCVGDDFTPARPGWNAEHGVFQVCSLQPEPLDLASSRAVLEDLICDFPFASPADRANYIGLLLTVILRPAIAEPVPMHLIGSPVERTGKTKLAEIVLGCGLLGHPTPAMQLGVREEEREKRITAALLAGDAVIHLDNLHEFVDSPALASLLTSSVYRGRELGHTRLLALPNGVTIVGTGNNVHATGEISKRVVPIMLQPATEAPETRQDYRHPLLRSYVESQRPRVLGALLGILGAWRAAGRPLGTVGFGGFERWSSVIGGIMACAGYPDWCSNLSAWRGTTDDFGTELRAFVEHWEAEYGSENWIAVSALYDLASKHGLFDRKLNRSTERGNRTAFGQSVISAAAGRVVGRWRIEVKGEGARRRARLN